MEVSAINPFKYLVVSRVLATTLSMPLLMLYSAVIGLAGSFIDVAAKDKTNFGVFVHDAFAKLGYAEICSTLLRSLIFGFTIGIIGCYKGYTATKGTEGVGRAANASVIIIMFLIFLEEITVVKIFNAFYTKQA
jgi:phospholipid/cholesterol/gamma-HCH transport system permease protein